MAISAQKRMTRIYSSRNFVISLLSVASRMSAAPSSSKCEPSTQPVRALPARDTYRDHELPYPTRRVPVDRNTLSRFTARFRFPFDVFEQHHGPMIMMFTFCDARLHETQVQTLNACQSEGANLRRSLQTLTMQSKYPAGVQSHSGIRF